MSTSLRRARRGGAAAALGGLCLLGLSAVAHAGALPPPHATPGEIIGVAGGSLNYPDGMAVDSDGDVFFADAGDNMVREVTASGRILDIAGTGIAGYYGDGGPAYNAELDYPTSVALDSSGDLFIADSDNNVIREVQDAVTDGSDGTIVTYAGDGDPGYSGDGGAPTSAELDDPTGVAVSPDGIVAIADTGNDVVRAVELVRIVTRPSSTRSHPHINPIFHIAIETVAGIAGSPGDSGDGGPATNATLDYPWGVAYDSHDDLYIADTGNSAVREVGSTTGDISTFAHVPYPTGVAVAPNGTVDVADPIQNRVVVAHAGGAVTPLAGNGTQGSSGDGKAATTAELNFPEGVADDAYGDVFVADSGNSLLREVVAARAPLFVSDSPPLIVATRGAYAASFSAVGVPEPTYSLTGAPAWLSVNATTGAVKGTLPAAVTRFTYSVVATNGSGHATAGPFVVTVPVAPVYVSSPGAGTFIHPLGLGGDASGDTWVADSSTRRLEELGANNEIVASLDSTSSGAFTSPTGVAETGADLWVVDSGASRLLKVDPSTGELIASYGAGILDDPTDVVTGPAGDAYVTDSGHDRVVLLSAGGDLVRSFGAAGHGSAQFEDPTGIALDPSGNVWVADTGNRRVEKFTSTGQYLASYTATATGFKAFLSPWGVAADSHGDIWVSDSARNDITELSTSGAPALQFGRAGSGTGELDDPTGLSVTPSGVVTVADTAAHQVERFAPPAPPHFAAATPPLTAVAGYSYDYAFSVTGAPVPTLTLTSAPSWLSVEPNGLVEGTVPAGTTSFRFSLRAANTKGSVSVGPFTVAVTTFKPVSYKSQFGSGDLSEPADIAEDSAGDEFVTDFSANDVREFNSSGTLVRTIGSPGTSPGQLDEPVGDAVNGSTLYVTEEGTQRVSEFSTATGAFLKSFGADGTGNGDFTTPFGVAIDGAGHIWVSDIDANRVQEFSASGTYMAQIDSSTSLPLKTPTGIAFLPDGDLVVANFAGDDLVVLTPTGHLVATYGSVGSGDGEFDGVYMVAVDKLGNIWASDPGNHRVQVLSPSGEFLQAFGTSGTGAGEFESPTGISINSAGVVSVSDSTQGIVEQWAP